MVETMLLGRLRYAFLRIAAGWTLALGTMEVWEWYETYVPAPVCVCRSRFVDTVVPNSLFKLTKRKMGSVKGTTAYFPPSAFVLIM